MTINKTCIYCCNCQKNVNAELINGNKVYPHRKDLYNLYFWQCQNCKGFVGTHKNSLKHKPLGVIPTKELKQARQKLHFYMDRLWKSGKIKRGKLYSEISEYVGYPYHNAETRTVAECEKVLKFIKDKYYD